MPAFEGAYPEVHLFVDRSVRQPGGCPCTSHPAPQKEEPPLWGGLKWSLLDSNGFPQVQAACGVCGNSQNGALQNQVQSGVRARESQRPARRFELLIDGQCQRLTAPDDLWQVIAAWPTLQPTVSRAILRLIDAAAADETPAAVAGANMPATSQPPRHRVQNSKTSERGTRPSERVGVARRRFGDEHLAGN